TRGEPDLVAEAAGIGAEGDEVFGLAHDAVASGDFTLQHVKQERAFLLLEELSRGFELLLDDFRHTGQGNELAMDVLERGAGGGADVFEDLDVAVGAFGLELD